MLSAYILILLLFPAGRGVGVLICVGAAVAPPVANLATGVGATTAGVTAPTCGHGIYATSGIVGGIFPKDPDLQSILLFQMFWVNLLVTC